MTTTPDHDPLKDYRAEIEKTGKELDRVRRREELTRSKLREQVKAALRAGMSELEASKLSGVARVTVREWNGK